MKRRDFLKLLGVTPAAMTMPLEMPAATELHTASSSVPDTLSCREFAAFLDAQKPKFNRALLRKETS